MPSNRIAHLLFIGLAAFATWSAASISWVHFNAEASCPVLGWIAACYLILISYIAILVSAFWQNRTLFFAGWSVIFTLALLGSISELTSMEAVCPRTSGIWAIPQCYLSFGIALLLLPLFLITIRTITFSRQGSVDS